MICSNRTGLKRLISDGFTLPEVCMSIFISTLGFGGIMMGYVLSTDRAEWSSYSLAAQSLAMQGVEQARSAKWDPLAWPPVDELGVTNYTHLEVLDLPVSGAPRYGTCNVAVVDVSVSPPLREIRSSVVWSVPWRKGAMCGPFTNTVVTLRAADQ
jgi:hypothetical protein